jgi:hypothetical protein
MVGIKARVSKYAGVTLAAAAVTIAGVGVTAASADGGPPPGGNRPANRPPLAGARSNGGAPFQAAIAVDQPVGFRADLLAAAATRLGLSRAALAQELGGGVTLAQVSLRHGVPLADLKTTLVDAEDASLQQATAAGAVTQAQANQEVSNIPPKVQAFLDRVVGGRPGGAQPGNRPAGGQPAPGTTGRGPSGAFPGRGGR